MHWRTIGKGRRCVEVRDGRIAAARHDQGRKGGRRDVRDNLEGERGRGRWAGGI
jgi:hypothetical protein